MSDERDPKVSQNYRDLRAEEPPRELDQAILAAAHRAADKPHAPLVAPAGRHRWYFAFGAAAVLALSIAITVQLEGERPDPEAVSVAQRPLAREDIPVPEAKAPPQRYEPESRELARARPAPARKALPEEPIGKPAPPTPRAPVEAGAEKRQEAAIESPRAPAASAAQPMMSSRMADAAAPESPERWVERIVELRKAGRHEDAEKELAEFRKRYPDYKIPEAALK